MSYNANTNVSRGWNTSDLDSMETNRPRYFSQIPEADANLPPSFSRRARPNPASQLNTFSTLSEFNPMQHAPRGWNTSEFVTSTSHRDRQTPLSKSGREPPNPEPQSNVFATGDLVEALALPPSTSRNSPARRPISPRKHKQQSPRHPSALGRVEEAARAARMHRALAVRQGPSRPQPPVTPRSSVRQPLAALRQSGDTRSPVALQPQQAAVIPHSQSVQVEGTRTMRRQRGAAMYPAANSSAQILYQTLQPAGPQRRY